MHEHLLGEVTKEIAEKLGYELDSGGSQEREEFVI
jgi:hypothetical protein